jgi:hypothetical protein
MSATAYQKEEDQKDLLRKEIARQTRVYLLNGGTIRKCTPGESAYDLSEKNSLERMKKSGFDKRNKPANVYEMEVFRRSH